MIKSSIDKHMVNWLITRNRMNKLNFNISIQRKEIWDKEHKSNLICSMLIGVPVESMLFEEDGLEGFIALDGKQRCLTIIQYVNNEFAISDKVKIPVVMGVDLIGKTFSELPENLQETIKEYELSIAVLRTLTEDEREHVFFLRNQAVALSKIELTRVVMGSKLMDYVKEITNHSFLLNKINVTDVARKKYLDQELVLQCLILVLNKGLSFSGKDLNTLAKELRHTGLELETKDLLMDILDYLDSAVVELNKSLKKIHIPMLISIVGKFALRNKLEPERFNEWMESFFIDIKEIGNEYAVACQSGSAQRQNVIKRLNYMENHYLSYFAEGVEVI